MMEQKYKKDVFSDKQEDYQKIPNSVTKIAIAHSTKYRKQSETTDTNISLQNAEYRMWYFDNYEQDFGSASGSLIL